jgi:hypothetical protein
MQALAIGRNWRASFACSLVLLAVLWYAGRPGDTHGYKVTHVSLAETIALIDAGAPRQHGSGEDPADRGVLR